MFTYCRRVENKKKIENIEGYKIILFLILLSEIFRYGIIEKSKSKVIYI